MKSGAYVTARSVIGTLGNTGYSRCKTVNNFRYLYLAVKHVGTNGSYVEVLRMLGCVGGLTRVWPQALVNNRLGAWLRWNEVPASTPDPSLGLEL